MEVLTDEESRLVMESMVPPFIQHPLSKEDLSSLSASGQDVLLIHGPGQDYKLTQNHGIPELRNDNEILVKVMAVGLNPIDWKGPDFNFGLPSLPWINGRDLAGVVVKAHRNLRRLRVGDVVLSPSTDYRDIRKAAFQEYVISTEHNSARVPRDLPIQTSAVIGVAFVTAALALGVCIGLDFSTSATLKGPNLFELLREVEPIAYASDIREECLNGITKSDRAKPGDWIAIWGASSATGVVALQLAKLSGLRTIAIVDVAKYGEKLLAAGAELLVDRLDTERAIAVVRGVTNGRLRFAFDTVGRETADYLQRALGIESSHLIGLTGLPKTATEGVAHHNVPIKSFHDIPKIGETLMVWLEQLLLTKRLIGPEVETAMGGLSGINKALGLLREGAVTGKRLVVPLEQRTAIAA